MNKNQEKNGLKTKRDIALWRVKASCRLGREALEGKHGVEGVTAVDYALYNLLHAVEDIAVVLGVGKK